VDFSSFASFKRTVEQIDFTPFYRVIVIDFDCDYFYVARFYWVIVSVT